MERDGIVFFEEVVPWWGVGILGYEDWPGLSCMDGGHGSIQGQCDLLPESLHLGVPLEK